MTTRFYLRGITSSVGGAGGRVLSYRLGRASTNAITTTVASGTNITVTATAGGQALAWFSEPINKAVTISGNINQSLYGLESGNAVNAGCGILIERCNNAGTVLSTIVPDTVVGAEYGTASSARSALVTPTSTAMAVGERIKFTWKVRNVGTMGAGTVTNAYDGPNEAAVGSSYLNFTEDIFTDEVLDVPAFEIYGSNGYRG